MRSCGAVAIQLNPSEPDLVANFGSNTVTVQLHTGEPPSATLLTQFDATVAPMASNCGGALETLRACPPPLPSAGDKVHYESSHSTVKKVAQNLLRQRLGEAERGELERHKVTFEQLVQLIVSDYRMNGRKSLVRVQQCLRHLRAALGG